MICHARLTIRLQIKIIFEPYLLWSEGGFGLFGLNSTSVQTEVKTVFASLVHFFSFVRLLIISSTITRAKKHCQWTCPEKVCKAEGNRLCYLIFRYLAIETVGEQDFISPAFPQRVCRDWEEVWRTFFWVGFTSIQDLINNKTGFRLDPLVCSS